MTPGNKRQTIQRLSDLSGGMESKLAEWNFKSGSIAEGNLACQRIETPVWMTKADLSMARLQFLNGKAIR